MLFIGLQSCKFLLRGDLKAFTVLVATTSVNCDHQMMTAISYCWYQYRVRYGTRWIREHWMEDFELDQSPSNGLYSALCTLTHKAEKANLPANPGREFEKCTLMNTRRTCIPRRTSRRIVVRKAGKNWRSDRGCGSLACCLPYNPSKSVREHSLGSRWGPQLARSLESQV